MCGKTRIKMRVSDEYSISSMQIGFNVILKDSKYKTSSPVSAIDYYFATKALRTGQRSGSGERVSEGICHRFR